MICKSAYTLNAKKRSKRSEKKLLAGFPTLEQAGIQALPEKLSGHYTLYQFYLLIADVGFVIPAKAGIQFLLLDIMCNSFGNF